MNSQDTILAAPAAQPAAENKSDGQWIIVSRLKSCPVWMVAALIGCLFFSGWTCWYRAGTEVPQPLDTINPNTAPVESLVRLPGIGPARAMAVVDYRRTHGGTEPVFQAPQDLDAIAGFGPKTVEQMMPWISFEDPGQ